ncbi:MAG: DsbA family protein [Gammaproteobacteria bacterium]|nr:MAG: DsbA family protein [Gammaproteobacteria bacterium]
MKPVLFYIHDPMCSWCWGFTQTLNKLLEHLPEDIEVKRLLGGLAPDTDIPMPESMQEYVKSNWLRIEDTIPGIKFNFDFWSENTPRRSTYPACRAVIAARQQGDKYDVLMTKKIQQAYYRQARNPSDDNVLIELAGELGMDVNLFTETYYSGKSDQILNAEIGQCREMFVESYPSLVLMEDRKITNINIDYNYYNIMCEQIENLI